MQVILDFIVRNILKNYLNRKRDYSKLNYSGEKYLFTLNLLTQFIMKRI